jgi:hypothetical protein
MIIRPASKTTMKAGITMAMINLVLRLFLEFVHGSAASSSTLKSGSITIECIKKMLERKGKERKGREMEEKRKRHTDVIPKVRDNHSDINIVTRDVCYIPNSPIHHCTVIILSVSSRNQTL